MTINYRTIKEDGHPPYEGNYPHDPNRTSKPVLVWHWEEHSDKYFCLGVVWFEFRRGMWNASGWRSAVSVDQKDRWVWVDELKPKDM